MNNSGALLDAFAELRRTWDELIALQPDVTLASGPLSSDELAQFAERVAALQVANIALEDEIELLRARKGDL